MRSAGDAMVYCPYDERHKMPKPRLQWHLATCKTKKEHEASGNPTYRCKYNFFHIYFDGKDCSDHEAHCQSAPAPESETASQFSA